MNRSSGIVLLIATAIALSWANSPWRASYGELWIAAAFGRRTRRSRSASSPGPAATPHRLGGPAVDRHRVRAGVLELLGRRMPTTLLARAHDRDHRRSGRDPRDRDREAVSPLERIEQACTPGRRSASCRCCARERRPRLRTCRSGGGAPGSPQRWWSSSPSSRLRTSQRCATLPPSPCSSRPPWPRSSRCSSGAASPRRPSRSPSPVRRESRRGRAQVASWRSAVDGSPDRAGRPGTAGTRVSPGV